MAVYHLLTCILTFQLVMWSLSSAHNKMSGRSAKVHVKDWPCVFSSPCYCNYNYRDIYCNNAELEEIPPILNYLGGGWSIDLSNNKLTSIPDRVFVNITITSLDLSNNNIVQIAENAFYGSETSLYSVHLEHNQLKVLPTFLGKMGQLTELHLEGNPILNLDNVGVFRNISGKLSTFSFGSTSLAQWPSAFQYLANIFELDMYDLQFDRLPDDAFEGLGTRLMYLKIYSTNLKSIPPSLNNASRLYHLELTDNTFLTQDGLLPVSFQGLHELREIEITNCPIDTIPPIFNDLSGLGRLVLSNVPLSYVNESVFPTNFSSEFYKFVFNNTQLERIPGPKLWARVPTIFEIAVTYNSKLTHIANEDLTKIPGVAFLYLSGNALVSISDNAFHTCKEVTFLYLDNNPLTTFPRAIANNNHISELDLSNTKIICSCENLGWMKHWSNKPKSLSVQGRCYNNDTSLKDYIDIEIPKCPNTEIENYYNNRN